MISNSYFPGSYQPYYNPQPVNNYYPGQQAQQAQYAQQSNTQNIQNSNFMQQNNPQMIWVQGEVGEKSFNRPLNWPSNTPLPLWDSENPYIYLKSWDNAGKASITKVSISIEESPDKKNTEIQGTDPAFVNAEDFEKLKSTSVTREEFNEFKHDMYAFLKANGFDDGDSDKKEDK